MLKNYEAYDKVNDVCIYSGKHQSSMVIELEEYINGQNHINEDLISEIEIKTLNERALKKIGIAIYINVT